MCYTQRRTRKDDDLKIINYLIRHPFGMHNAAVEMENITMTLAHNELKREKKSPFWQDNALFASKAKINIF